MSPQRTQRTQNKTLCPLCSLWTLLLIQQAYKMARSRPDRKVVEERQQRVARIAAPHRPQADATHAPLCDQRPLADPMPLAVGGSEEHTSELQSPTNLVCR